MLLPSSTIDHESLMQLVEEGRAVRAEVVGQAGAWGIVIRHGRAHQTLTARRGHMRLFRRFETLVAYLKTMGITAFHVDASDFDLPRDANESPDKRSAVASQRMKRAHEAAAYDVWFRESVRASIEDPRPNIDHEDVRKEFEARRAALRSRAKGAMD